MTRAETLMVAAGKARVWLTPIGHFGGDDVTLGRVSAPLAGLSTLYRNSFADIFA